MSKRKSSFRLFYLIYVAVLAALIAVAVVSVNTLLLHYEAAQPQVAVRAAAEQLADDVRSGAFERKYPLAQVEPGPLEQGRDLHKEYLALYTDGELSVSEKSGSHAEDELFYLVERDGFPLAEVKLKAQGPAVTKLAVFTMRDWAVESVTPIWQAHEYTLRVPSSFTVQVNGMALQADPGTTGAGRQTTYTVSGLYLKPEFVIADGEGVCAPYALKNNRVMAEYFDYSLTLPTTLNVTLNGNPYTGNPTGDGLVRYDITRVTEPTVVVADCFGNTLTYDGSAPLPLTYAAITADSTDTVQVNDAPVPQQAISTRVNPEYVHFADYVPGLPQLCTYSIAILQDNAQITVIDDQAGTPVVLDSQGTDYDFTARGDALPSVPEQIARQVDVLTVAQSWSKFLTRDLGFQTLEQYLIPGSYQYQAAHRYATGEDIKFISKHTLADPAFTDISVDNFLWITEDCFSVDIRFVKHMRLYYGAMVEDPMNDRFYFVRYDATNDGVANPTWKLASMKEIVT